MDHEPLNKPEQEWLEKIENLLENPPTNRIGFSLYRQHLSECTRRVKIAKNTGSDKE
mgnify:FL=1|tara:strand:- start:659 stop:829 length:171 start_codon:yes stop_codon:yes gene_type:complete